MSAGFTRPVGPGSPISLVNMPLPPEGTSFSVEEGDVLDQMTTPEDEWQEAAEETTLLDEDIESNVGLLYCYY